MLVESVDCLYLHLVGLSGLQEFRGHGHTCGFLIHIARHYGSLIGKGVHRRDYEAVLPGSTFLLHAHVVLHLHCRGVVVLRVAPRYQHAVGCLLRHHARRTLRSLIVASAQSLIGTADLRICAVAKGDEWRCIVSNAVDTAKLRLEIRLHQQDCV